MHGTPPPGLLLVFRAAPFRPEARPALALHARAALLVPDHSARGRRPRGRILCHALLFLAATVHGLLRDRHGVSFGIHFFSALTVLLLFRMLSETQCSPRIP